MLNKQLLLLKRQGIRQYLSKKLRKFNFIIKLSKFYPKNQNKKWIRLKDKYKGQRVFLIGNGPSLNKTPLFLLKNENVMCFNRFHLMLERVNWLPNFYTIVDNLVLDDLLNEFDIVEENSEEVFIPAVHPHGDVFVNRVRESSKVNWFRHKPFGSGFSKELPYVFGGGTVIFEGFQILRHLGFSEIIIVGVDMNYQIHKSVKTITHNTNNIESLSDDDPNHFDPRYFGKGKKYHQPEDYVIKNILENLKRLSEMMDSLRINIINAGYDSRVNYFSKQDIYNVLQFNENEIKEIFEDCIKVKTKYSSLENLLKNCVEDKIEINDVLDCNQNYVMTTNIGIKFVKKHVDTHVCYGPHLDKLYFVSRVNLKK